MMKHLLVIASCILLFAEKNTALNITIIDSQTYNSGQTMDTRWQTVCQAMGHTATIYPKTKLDLLSNLSTTDILIVSSAVDTVLTSARVSVITQYAQNGGKVYLQSEYLSTFDGNIAFQNIVNSLGGYFNWSGVVAGTLNPMNIIGSIATDSAATGPLTNYWYGQSIDPCSSVEMFLQYLGQYFGCIYCVPFSAGRIITCSDQDWTFISNTWASDSLMKNIIINLSKTSYNCVSSGTSVNINLGNDTTLCSGNTLLLNAGSGYTNYLWQNGQTTSSILVSASGTYSVQAVSPCTIATGTINVTVTTCNLPVAVFTSSDTAFCNEGGKCIDFFDHSSDNPTSWKWLFPGAIPDTSTQQNPTSICYFNAGTYAVTLIVSNANGTDTLSVSPMITLGTTPPSPTITHAGGDTLVCSHAATYQWFYNGIPIASATDSFYVAVNNGSYNVYVTDSIGCNALGNGILFTSIKDIISDSGLMIYPNPAGEQFTVYGLQFTVKTATIELFNVLGEKVYTRYSILSTPYFSMDLSAFAKGLYVVQLTAGNRTYRAKVVKQ